MYWLLVGVAIAGPEITVESASIQLASGATVTAERATVADGQIVGQGVSAEEETLTIRADSTHVSLDGDRGSFQGSVHAQRGDLSFWAERVDVEFDSDGTVSKVTAAGGVKVRQGEREAQGETALFQNGRLILSGQPRVRQGANEMLGEQIIFVVGRQTVECIQCTMKVEGVFRP